MNSESILPLVDILSWDGIFESNSRFKHDFFYKDDNLLDTFITDNPEKYKYSP